MRTLAEECEREHLRWLVGQGLGNALITRNDWEALPYVRRIITHDDDPEVRHGLVIIQVHWWTALLWWRMDKLEREIGLRCPVGIFWRVCR